MKINNIRNEYKYAELSKISVHENPVSQFENWMNEALESKVAEPTAMSLSTVGTDGFPQSRIVLLKFFDENGFIFFTNYNSSKAKSIEKHPQTSLHFFWPELERQVRITGIAEKTSPEISDSYFKSRPEASQIAAWASHQSEEIPNRKHLQQLFEKYKIKFENTPLICPDFWGGFLVKPVKMEFWQGRENRLHDRILYEKEAKKWLVKRLAP